jgi:ribonuclease HIII
MTQRASHTYTLNPAQVKALRGVLEERSFEFSDLEYGHFKAVRGKCSVAAYHSGKVVVQGKDSREFLEFHFEPRVLGEARLGYEEVHHPDHYEPHLGIDEAGKGDFFGPLVVAGACVDRESVHALLEAGVCDSKRIGSDKRAEELSDAVEEILGRRRIEVLAMGPQRYGELYESFGNLNRLLAWGHGKVIQLLAERNPAVPRALSDQFAHPSLIQRELGKKGVKIKLEQRTKAESDPAVAAASVLARAAFVRGLRKLGERVGRE